MFVVDYPANWQTFFSDLMQMPGPQGADLYLRIMKAIDTEVVDREVVHSPEVKSM